MNFKIRGGCNQELFSGMTFKTTFGQFLLQKQPIFTPGGTPLRIEISAMVLEDEMLVYMFYLFKKILVREFGPVFAQRHSLYVKVKMGVFFMKIQKLMFSP